MFLKDKAVVALYMLVVYTRIDAFTGEDGMVTNAAFEHDKTPRFVELLQHQALTSREASLGFCKVVNTTQVK